MKLLLLATVSAISLAASAPPTAAQLRWFNTFDGQPQAQYETAVMFWQQQQKSAALYWWQRAAKSGSERSLIALLEHFPASRPQWLQLGVEQGNETAIIQLATYQLHDAQMSWTDWRARWWRPSYQKILSANWGDIDDLEGDPALCRETVTVLGNSHAGKSRYLRLLKHIEQSPLPSRQWCFEWRTEPQLSCQLVDGTLRAECGQQHPDAANNAARQQRVIMLAEQGKASSSQTRITLTTSSQREVVAHELGHWLGLADEYAMAQPLAEAFCRGGYNFDPLNIVLTDQQTMTAGELKALWQRLPWRDAISDWRSLGKPLTNNRWQLGSSKQHAAGLYPAATCATVSGVYAWKPVPEQTAMERHQSGHWPPLYLKLIGQRLMAN